MTENISIIGAGGHTRSSIVLLKHKYKIAQLKIYDNDCLENETICGVKITRNIENIDKNSKIFISIGDNMDREKYFYLYKNRLLEENIFHKNSYCEDDIKIGISNQIFANAYINSYVEIGDNNIINTSAILEHEVIIGSHNHISVGAKLCGRVKIGNNCMIGANATIIDKVSLGDNVIIGAGSVVIKNITENGTYAGIPIRKIK